MGLLVKGKWHDQWYNTEEADGEFIREDSQYRNWITADGGAGPTGEGGFVAEADRYHLYVSLACPWAHRTLIFRNLKKLQNIISVSVVHPHMLEKGWTFENGVDGATGDDLYQQQYLYEIYCRDNSQYSGRVTVPVLWDKQREVIVNNESSEIIRMFNSAFNHITNNHDDFYPDEYQKKIDEVNHFVYRNINNGVYRTGFATTQVAYEKAFDSLFDALDVIDNKLSNNRYLTGEKITEADWRLFTTLIRFDAVYVGHFKCNQKRIEDYKHLSGYLRELYQYPGVKETVDFFHIKQHYYFSHTMINPTQVVPAGPELNLDDRHQRHLISQ
jgi:putative glutathione S-transferase